MSIQTIHAALMRNHWFFFMQHSRSFPHLLPLPTPHDDLPPKSTILPAKNLNNMSVYRCSDRYVCHFRRWLGCEVNGRLDEQIEQVWFNLCGLRDEVFWVSAAKAGVLIDKGRAEKVFSGDRKGRFLKKKKILIVSFCYFLISFR